MGGKRGRTDELADEESELLDGVFIGVPEVDGHVVVAVHELHQAGDLGRGGSVGGWVGG